MAVIETITPAEPGYRFEEEAPVYIMGVDLGQSMDPTAVAVIEHRKTFKHHHSGNYRKQTSERFDVRHLQRLPLGLSYPSIVAEVGRLAARPPIVGCEIIVDATGVGRPVADLLDVAGLRSTRVTITAGDAQSWTDGGWHVSKTTLISTLDARLHTGELRFAKELTEAGAMAEELKDFRRHVTASGRFQYEARATKHDDLVLAAAIALWALVGRPVAPVAYFGWQTISVPSSGGGGDGAQWGALGCPPDLARYK
jgi:hypothetical protein